MPESSDQPESATPPGDEAADATRIIRPNPTPAAEAAEVSVPSTPPGAPPLPSGTAPPATIAPGEILGHTYEIEAVLARGGMGEVYRARHTELGSEHAIKVILPELTSDPRIVGMFKEEAKKLRKVRNDAVVAYEGLFRDEFGRRFLVMEFVDGIPLSTIIKQRRLDPTEVRQLRDRCAEGLAAAHDKGIYHRDISPDNIILVGGRTELAKIIDFGIAKSADPGDRTVLGQDFAGKYSYVSPEQLGAFGGTVDGRSDIYSLGLVLVAAAQGRVLDMGNSPISVIEKRQSIPDLSGVPAELRAEIAPLLEPDPARRPQSMRELPGSALAKAREGAGAATITPTAASPPLPARTAEPEPLWTDPPAPAAKPPAAPTAPAPPPRRSAVPVILAATVSFLVVLGAGATWLHFSAPEKPASVAAATAAPEPAPATEPAPVAQTAAAPTAQPIAPSPPTPAPAAASAAAPSPPAAPPTIATEAPRPTPSPAPAPVAASQPAPPPPAQTAAAIEPAPVAKRPSPVPSTPVPSPVSAPVPAPTQAAPPPTLAPTRTAMLAPSREDVEAKLKDLIASFQCADVNTRLSGQSGLTLTGFVSRPEDLDRLHRELSGLQGVKLARDAVAVYAWPHCAIVKLLLQDANAAKTSAAPRLQFGKPDLVYHNGDKLTFKVGEERRRDAYLYIDYIDNSGQVVHMFPTPLRPANFVKAGQTISIGTADAAAAAKGDARIYEISEPFGPGLILAISSPKKLYETDPPEAEPADQYLRRLQTRLASLAAGSSGKDVTSSFTIIDTVK